MTQHMERFKRWLIHKLGGFTYSDLPVDLALEWLNRAANVTIDEHFKDKLKNGFETWYTKDR